MILCFSFNANVVPTFFGEYFELVALMGSWAQGISWLKFASVCRLLSFRVKLYLNLAPATAAIIWHTAQRTFIRRLDSPQTFRLRQCSWMKFRPLKLFVHYWNERDKYNQGLWNVCLDVMCGVGVDVCPCIIWSGQQLATPLTPRPLHIVHNPPLLSPPEYMMGWSWGWVMSFIFTLRTCQIF